MLGVQQRVCFNGQNFARDLFGYQHRPNIPRFGGIPWSCYHEAAVVLCGERVDLLVRYAERHCLLRSEWISPWTCWSGDPNEEPVIVSRAFNPPLKSEDIEVMRRADLIVGDIAHMVGRFLALSIDRVARRWRFSPIDTDELGRLCEIEFRWLSPEERVREIPNSVFGPYWLRAENKPPDSPDKPDKGNIPLPNSPDVLELCKMLQRERRKNRSQIEIAREFSKGTNKKPENLLRQATRYRHLWDMNGEPDT